MLVEVKTSRADFLADAKKAHRSGPGIGAWRYYMAPAGIIKLEDLAPGWGLLEVTPGGQIRAVAGHATSFRQASHVQYLEQADCWRFSELDHSREQYLLVRVLANTSPQKSLNLVREANQRGAQLTRRIDAIGAALGLPKGTSSYEIERRARLAARRRAVAAARSSSETNAEM